MRFLSDLAFRLRALVRRGSADADLRDELDHHLRLEIDSLRVNGMSAADAEREARRRLGSVAVQQETTRDGWGISLVTDFAADVRHALRQMRRRPGYSAIAILTVGLGIGATVALANVADTLIFRALPYADEDRIHVFWYDYSWRGDEYDFLRERRSAFAELAAYSTNGEPYVIDASANGGARLLPYVVATSSLFDVLGVKPALGQPFTAEDDRPNAPPVIVISHGMWQDELGGDPNVVGRHIYISGKETRIVGVMPKGFYFPTPQMRAWRPLQLEPGSQMYLNVGYLVLVGRLKPGLDQRAVQPELTRMGLELAKQFTYTKALDKSKDAHAVPVHEYLLGDVRDPLILLVAAGALLLLIASANTAALVLARTSDRVQEMMVRASLGAGTWRLVRQIGAESVVLALCAACVGAATALLGFKVLVGNLPLGSGFGGTVAPDFTVPTVAFALALVIAGAISIAPARSLLRRRFDAGFNRERSEAGLRASTRRTHGAIVAAQVGLAIVLAVGAGLLIRTVDRLRAIDPGFTAKDVATFTIVGRGDVPKTVTHHYLNDIVARVRELPGVSAAGVINRLPIRDGGFQGGVEIEGRPDLAGPLRPNLLYRVVSPGFFTTMGIRVVEGRAIDSTDVESGKPVTVITESVAKKMWPNESALGRHVSTHWTGTLKNREVVGVVREPRLRSMLGESAPAMFVPFDQDGFRSDGAVLVVRSPTPMATLVPEVRRVATELDPQVAVARIESMDGVVAESLAQPLRLRFFLGLFAIFAIALSAVGVYGTVSYAVARRRAEFGIHLALGATPSRVLADVVKKALTPVTLGIAAGLAAALLGSGAVRRFLYGVAPSDPASLAVAGATLLGAAVIAALIPALRASKTSPAESLRAE